MEAVNSRKEAKPKSENQEERKITCISMESEKESKLAPARRTMTEKRSEAPKVEDALPLVVAQVRDKGRVYIGAERIKADEKKEGSLQVTISKGVGEKIPNLEELEFEARSSKDGAWYDVDTFLCHRYTCSGEAEVRVRFVGFGVEEDEWVNVKNAVRERSIPLEHTECHKLKTGDLVLCFQERRDQAIYYDAHVKEIQRRMHDIRGCRCLFLIRYDHDNSEERVRLRRLCRRPTY
ncbi:protein SAWADEE HOMEODOMAIN HOMOLOG 2-like [Carica papaya]|uniref:protein SAWADEE HOMEODOMAIN HOMOLOG 2-like n=1 Tax=Carica papaya TaxID=3649 RepID=UPI000B8CC100|nr:protein SAWADEE HOMEODOMAIN HOMOLOG 2-like [Carica papaya]